MQGAEAKADHDGSHEYGQMQMGRRTTNAWNEGDARDEGRCD